MCYSFAYRNFEASYSCMLLILSQTNVTFVSDLNNEIKLVINDITYVFNEYAYNIISNVNHTKHYAPILIKRLIK